MTDGHAPPPGDKAIPDFLRGGGEMGRLIRGMDWSTTSLGPVEEWPQSLRTTVSLCLSSTFPILIAWGPDRVQIYNDTYRPICGEKHPVSMGQRFNECWASALPAVGHVLDRAQTGEGSYLENLRMFLDRYGYLEEAFMTFSFSPIRVESGEVGGLFHPITETTDKMLASRRTQVLHELSARIGTADSMEQLGERLSVGHDGASLDVPFLLFYSLGEGTSAPRLLGRAGFQPTGDGKDTVLPDRARDGSWMEPDVARSDAPRVLDDLESRLGPVEAGPYPEPVKSAVVLPIHPPGASAPIGCLVAGVSSRRILDPGYRSFYDQLGQLVTSAVASIRAREEEQAKAEALAQIDRAKTAFFSNVSHEFRTPLTLMLGPLEELLSAGHELSDRTRREVERVRRNGQRLLKLVNSLLDFSRIEAGRMEATYEATDLASQVTNLASTFRSLIEGAGLVLVVDCPPPSQSVWVDRGLFEKVVLNLLSNAFKFTFEGEIRVTLAAHDGNAELTVSDTGIGVAPGELPRLFERFHRVQGATGRSIEGSGIGLALVQELVRLHGGDVSASSTLGKGTSFTVRIPFGTAHLPEARVSAQKETRPVETRPAAAYVDEAAQWGSLRPGPMAPVTSSPDVALASMAVARVLLVDDNADMRAYVRGLLEPRFVVEEAANGYLALAAAREREPDLVLSDVMMPELDGFGLLAALRGDVRTAHIPVILLSARAGEESTVEGLTAGASDYLVKPFSAHELLARVEGNVRSARARQDLDAFAGRIAHDLRNLLSPLSLVATQMRMGDERTRKTGQRLERLSRRSQNLLDGMLAFSRASDFLTEDAQTPVAAVVSDVVEDLTALRDRVGAVIDLDDVENVVFPLPRGLLYVVILNLVQNALKFMEGRPERCVKVMARVVGEACELRVRDTGPGIPSGVVEHIFEPFYRAPGASASGHGIGLATVRRIASAAGGQLTVSSTVGEGTEFTLALRQTDAVREAR